MPLMYDLWLNVKQIWSIEARAESIVAAQISSYRTAKRNQPEEDPNSWLATAISSRPGWRLELPSMYYVLTAPYSILSQEAAPEALGIRVLQVEGGEKLNDKAPSLAERYESRFEVLMKPVFQLTGSEFLSRWEIANPFSAQLSLLGTGRGPTIKDRLTEWIGSQATDGMERICRVIELGMLLPTVSRRWKNPPF